MQSKPGKKSFSTNIIVFKQNQNELPKRGPHRCSVAVAGPSPMPGFHLSWPTWTTMCTHNGCPQCQFLSGPFSTQRKGYPPAGPSARLFGPHVQNQGRVWGAHCQHCLSHRGEPVSELGHPQSTPGMCVPVQERGRTQEQRLPCSELRTLPCLHKKQNALFLISSFG